jgi:DNA invertase Pin-like site-specific DNA recombinase
MIQMACVFAEFERGIIRERIVAGLDRAKKIGTRSGNAIGRPKTAEGTEEKIRAQLAEGHGMLKTAKACGVGVSVVVRIKEAMAQQAV